MTPVFAFEEASHKYTLDGQRLPSVTEILAPIKQDFSMVPRDVLEAKRAFGSAVHLACELDDTGELDDDATDPDVMGCVQAWRLFKEHSRSEILMNEQRLYHPTMRYAGTLDRLVTTCAFDKPNQKCLIDLKTSEDAHPSYGVQLAGYRLLIAAQEETWPLSEGFGAMFRGIGIDPIARASVHLDKSGRYRFHQYKDPNDEATFVSCLAIHRFKEINK